MSGGSHYPDYYLRKRRRDTTYRRVVSIIVGVVLIGVIGGCTGFLVWNMVIKPNREQAPQPADQARQRNELNTEQRIADARNNSEEQTAIPNEHQESGTSSMGSVTTELGGIEYSQSIPAIKVSIEGSNKEATKRPDNESEDAGETGEAAASQVETGNPTPPGEREQPATFSSKPEEKPQAVNDKPEEKDVEKKPEEKPQETASEETSAAAGERVFHVYAGACSTQEDAEKMKSNLSSLGFQGTIIKSKLDYLVKVASLGDYDSANSLKEKLQASGFEKAFATRSRK